MDRGISHLQRTVDGMAQVLLIWYATPPSSWDISAGTTSTGSSGHLSSKLDLVFQDVPMRGTCALMSCSLTLVSWYIQGTSPSYSPAVCSPSMPSLVHRVGFKNLFFSPSHLPSQLPQEMPEVSRMVANRMLLHPYLPLIPDIPGHVTPLSAGSSQI